MKVADDTVAVRMARARGVTETALRRQLAGVPTPHLRRFLFVRRVRIRAGPNRIGRAIEAALDRLTAEDGQDVLAFPDLPSLAVACARAAAAGGLSGWHWRTLGLPRLATPGEAVAALLTAHPQEAGSAVAALAAQGLLAAAWRTMPDAAAARLGQALAQAAGVALPAWPVGVTPVAVPSEAGLVVLLARAAVFWAPALATLAPGAEAVRTAAVLALLRWSPVTLRAPASPAWPALLARIAGVSAAHDRLPPTLPPAHEPPGSGKTRGVLSVSGGSDVADAPGVMADDDGPGRRVEPHGRMVATGWGGVLFLINALQRVDIEALLTAMGDAAPTGWRVLLEVGSALGLPANEPLAQYLAEQDLETAMPPLLLGVLLAGIEALYAADGPRPLPLVQLGRLRATETHLDLDMEAGGVDLAVRLAGLDLDPGWVAWLGRVVAFHYPSMPTHQRRAL